MLIDKLGSACAQIFLFQELVWNFRWSVICVIINSYSNNEVVGSLFQYWHDIKKYFVGSTSRERSYSYWTIHWKISFPSNQISLNYQLLRTFLLTKKALERFGVDGTLIIIVTFDLPSYFPKAWIFRNEPHCSCIFALCSFTWMCVF